jgi:hypothetical protein
LPERLHGLVWHRFRLHRRAGFLKPEAEACHGKVQ